MKACNYCRHKNDQIKELQEQAFTDDVTELPNRRAFMDTLSMSISQRRQCTLLYIDLNGFKEINDTQGHVMGDKMLHEIGQRFRAVTRSRDIVARIGGDEFAMIIDGVDINAIANRCMSTGVSMSIGAIKLPRRCNPQKAMELADKAMYGAKRRCKQHGWASSYEVVE